MQTAEWSALYTLKGEIIRVSGDLGERVAFQYVLDATRAQLDTAAADPDLVELFDFLINLGVGKNYYFDDFAAFQRIFINSQQRQMRFTWF